MRRIRALIIFLELMLRKRTRYGCLAILSLNSLGMKGPPPHSFALGSSPEVPTPLAIAQVSPPKRSACRPPAPKVRGLLFPAAFLQSSSRLMREMRRCPLVLFRHSERYANTPAKLSYGSLQTGAVGGAQFTSSGIPADLDLSAFNE